MSAPASSTHLSNLPTVPSTAHTSPFIPPSNTLPHRRSSLLDKQSEEGRSSSYSHMFGHRPICTAHISTPPTPKKRKQPGPLPLPPLLRADRKVCGGGGEGRAVGREDDNVMEDGAYGRESDGCRVDTEGGMKRQRIKTHASSFPIAVDRMSDLSSPLVPSSPSIKHIPSCDRITILGRRTSPRLSMQKALNQTRDDEFRETKGEEVRYSSTVGSVEYRKGMLRKEGEVDGGRREEEGSGGEVRGVCGGGKVRVDLEIFCGVMGGEDVRICKGGMKGHDRRKNKGRISFDGVNGRVDDKHNNTDDNNTRRYTIDDGPYNMSGGVVDGRIEKCRVRRSYGGRSSSGTLGGNGGRTDERRKKGERCTVESITFKHRASCPTASDIPYAATTAANTAAAAAGLTAVTTAGPAAVTTAGPAAATTAGPAAGTTAGTTAATTAATRSAVTAPAALATAAASAASTTASAASCTASSVAAGTAASIASSTAVAHTVLPTAVHPLSFLSARHTTSSTMATTLPDFTDPPLKQSFYESLFGRPSPTSCRGTKPISHILSPLNGSPTYPPHLHNTCGPHINTPAPPNPTTSVRTPRVAASKRPHSGHTRTARARTPVTAARTRTAGSPMASVRTRTAGSPMASVRTRTAGSPMASVRTRTAASPIASVRRRTAGGCTAMPAASRTCASIRTPTASVRRRTAASASSFKPLVQIPPSRAGASPVPSTTQTPQLTPVVYGKDRGDCTSTTHTSNHLSDNKEDNINSNNVKSRQRTSSNTADHSTYHSTSTQYFYRQQHITSHTTVPHTGPYCPSQASRGEPAVKSTIPAATVKDETRVDGGEDGCRGEKRKGGDGHREGREEISRVEDGEDICMYSELGISISANEYEIKKAYKQMASMTHPDKPGGSNERFIRVRQAFDLLSVYSPPLVTALPFGGKRRGDTPPLCLFFYLPAVLCLSWVCV
eukprot:GHVQ01007916.1.p1 GENE.GHVQ01007916.1~~GHVQ01007916.1.p1  ORF type:complete len:952 (-),score=239.29 GHVQ01007916.1:47-2902(-)